MSPSKTPLLDAALAAMTDSERERWQSFIEALSQPDADTNAMRQDFYLWSGPLCARIGAAEPGPLWGEFMRTNRPKRTSKQEDQRPLAELADAFPYPLGMKLRAVLVAERARAEGEASEQFPFMLCQVMGVIVRLSALIAIKSYADLGGTDAQLNRVIVDSLRTPSDGAWLSVAQRLCNALDSNRPHPLLSTIRQAFKRKPKVAEAIRERARDGQGKRVTSCGNALAALVSYRNALVHAEPLDEADHDRALALLELALRGFSGLTDYELQVRHGQTTWRLNGSVPVPIDDHPDLPADDPCLVSTTGPTPPLSLSPLLRFRPADGDLNVELDELYFLNAGDLQRLSYIGYRATGQLDGRTLGSYDEFKRFLATIEPPPMPEEPRLDFSELAAFHSRLFVGRTDILDEIRQAIADPPTQYLILRALAGMGKSAIMGALLQAVLNHTPGEEAQALPCPADPMVRPQDRWVFHFCMSTDGRNSPTVAMRSLIAQICDHFDWSRSAWLSHDLEELKDQKFPALLLKASKSLGEDQRLIVAIDALDEGIGADKESIPSCIPAGTYPGVVFLVTYRVDEDGENTRVHNQLRHISDERRTHLKHASPLAGLTRPDVDRFLDKVAEARAEAQAAAAVQQATWDASTSDSATEPPTADPFYLRFVAEGVQAGTIRLDRAETVPESLDDAFEELWMGLPADRDFLCHRLLLTLGILREYGEDELFSELFNRERSDEERLTPDDIAAVRIQAGKLLVYDGDRYGLFHDRFRRFLVGEQKDPIAEALDML